jgi:hypothetical protein
MRAISVVLVVLTLSACAGTSPSRSTGPPAAEAGPCARSGGVTAEPGSSQSFQAGDRGFVTAIAVIVMLLALTTAIASCPRAAAGADTTPG